jgi:hypothetical protein
VTPVPLSLLAADLVEPASQQVTDWGARIAWTMATLLLVVLLYWLMYRGWRRRVARQGDLPDLPVLPGPSRTPGTAAGDLRLRMTGRYHGTTVAGQWLDRIVAHGLGARSRAELTLTEHGIDVVRPGARDFLIPASRIRGARLEKGIAGKVLTEGGLLVITWSHGDQLIDSGFRSDHSAEHPAWVEAINRMNRTTTRTTTTEGAAR